MALLPTTEGGVPSTIERIKTCLEGFGVQGVSGRHSNGRMKREGLVAIAASLIPYANSNTWVGPVLALLSESLDTDVINSIMAEGPGRYQEEWRRWDLGSVRFAWEKKARKEGEDRIRNLAYDLLIQDLKILYSGYTDSNGSVIRRLGVGEVCKKVKADIGFIVIRESCLREHLKNDGVPIRNQKGVPSVCRGRQTQPVGSASTVGPSTPASSSSQPVSPLPQFTSGVSVSSSRAPSRLPTPSRRPSVVQAPRGYPDPSITPGPAQGASQNQLSQTTNHSNEMGMSNYNTHPFEQQHSPLFQQATPRDSHGSGMIPIHPAGDDLTNGINDEHFNSQPVSTQYYNTAAGGNQFNMTLLDPSAPIHNWGTLGPRSVGENLDIPEMTQGDWEPMSNVAATSQLNNTFRDSNENLTQPLASAAKTPNNDDISAMLEQIQLLNRRLDVESTARVQLEKRANEVDKWKTDYVKLEDYKSIVQKSNNIERLYEALKEGRDNERETRANLGDGLEDLQQRYYRLDKMVQSLQNTKGELESKIISMHMVNDMQRMRIEDLEAGMNGAHTRLKDLESENSGLKTELGILQNDNAALHTDVTNLQTSNTKLDGQVLNLTNENDKLHQSLEGLQQHNNSLQADVTALQAENINLKTEVAELQKAKTNLDREVGLLKERNSSLQQENQTLKARLSKALSNGRLSNWTVDSGLGSPRESIASPRKRPISITEVREEKRPKGLERDSTFEGNVGSMSLPLEQIAEDSAMYEMSKLPYRSGRNSPEVPQSDGYFF